MFTLQQLAPVDPTGPPLFSFDAAGKSLGGRRQVVAIQEYAVLRELPQQLLLSTLHRRVLLKCNAAAAGHFEGLAQAGRQVKS